MHAKHSKHADHSKRTDRAQYERMRDNFNDLELEDQLTFLFESAAGTVARGLEEVVRTFSEGIDEAARTVRKAGKRYEKRSRKHGRRARGSRSTPSGGPGAAEPETSQRRAPRGPNRPNDADTDD